MKHGNTLTYVMSGCSNTRIVINGISPAGYDDMRSVMRVLNADHHKFGLLYNAWTEHRFGKAFRDNFADAIHVIQADSGGLQIVTQGKTITEEMKKKVYLNQGAWSDMAMSFDEIPLSFSGTKSSRLDLSNRWFDKDKFEFCARETGRNVRNQIESFIEHKSTAKPIFITQGNCYETYMRWTELALKEIPMELQPYIGGVAMGAAALGHGMLEDVRRAFYFTQLPMAYPANHLHLLAVGSAYRLIPNMIFQHSGLYKDLHLTIDSTTHSSGINMGRVYIDQKGIDFPRAFDKLIYQKMYDRIEQHFGKMPVDLAMFHQICNMPGSAYKEKINSDVTNYCTIAFRLAAMSVFEFKAHVDVLSNDLSEVIRQARARDQVSANCLEHLSSVKTKADFDYWDSTFSRFFATKPVQSTKPTSLESFFE